MSIQHSGTCRSSSGHKHTWMSCVDTPVYLCRVSSNPWGVGVGALPYDGTLVDLGTLPGSW